MRAHPHPRFPFFLKWPPCLIEKGHVHRGTMEWFSYNRPQDTLCLVCLTYQPQKHHHFISVLCYFSIDSIEILQLTFKINSFSTFFKARGFNELFDSINVWAGKSGTGNKVLCIIPFTDCKITRYFSDKK